MVKINDTITFSIQTSPALDDRFIGTDKSDTGNSADGEVVQFEFGDVLALLGDAGTDSPVMRSGWHPYDMVLAGDGADGLIYSATGSSGIYDVNFTPDAGYDYRLEFENIGHDSGVARDLYLSVTGTTTAVSTTTIVSAVASNGNVFGFIEFTAPGAATRLHKMRAIVIGGTAYYNPSGGFLSGETSWDKLICYATEEAIATINLDWAAGRGFVDGKIRLMRRRNYLGS